MKNFGWAIEQMLEDKIVRREAWSSEYCIFLRDIVIRDRIDGRRIDANLKDGTYLTGWTPSQEDMLSQDWIIAE